jgi:hypothetical protein
LKIEPPVLLAMIVLCGAAQSAQSKDLGLAGTYELLMCKGECSFSERANVLRTAVIVILDRAIKRKDAERIDSTYHDLKSTEAKACYTLKYPDRQVSGVTAWSLDRKTISFTLVRSKDSWYSVRVERNGDVLRGVGNFWSAGVAPPPGFIPDTIVGRRRGPADVAACKAEVK